MIIERLNDYDIEEISEEELKDSFKYTHDRLHGHFKVSGIIDEDFKPYRPLVVLLPFFAFQLVSSLFDDIPEIRTHLEKIHLDVGIVDHLTWIDKEVIAFYFK